MKNKRIDPWKVWLCLLVILVGCVALMFLLSGPPESSFASDPYLPQKARPEKSRAPSDPRNVEKNVTDGRDRRPRVVVILDDIGQNPAIINELKALKEYPLTISVLPFLPHTTQACHELKASGFEILLHLPMEPVSQAHNPGKGAILVSMTPDEIRRTTVSSLREIPGAVGVNNHMGSRATQSPKILMPVMEILHARSLFFVDSRTHQDSVAYRTARSHGVPTARRSVFLDNQDQVHLIRRQLDKLVLMALKEREAVGIGHGRPRTITALKRWLPEATRDPRYGLVYASEVVK